MMQFARSIAIGIFWLLAGTIIAAAAAAAAYAIVTGTDGPPVARAVVVISLAAVGFVGWFGGLIAFAACVAEAVYTVTQGTATSPPVRPPDAG